MNRRSFFLSGLGAAGVPAQTRRRPNVVFVLVDQWRAQAFGYTGDPNATTPAIDRLAAQSVDFTNAVSGFPVCSPYRASLMTGQYAVRHGLVVNDVELKPNGATLGEVFRRAGYRTGYIGKWHIHGSPDGMFGRRLSYIPPGARMGFDYWKACECTHDYNHSLYYEGSDETQRYWGGYDAVAQTADACEFIRQHGGATADPYLLVLSLGPPHDPYATAPERYRSMYANRAIQLRGNVPEHQAVQATTDLRGYYAHSAALDDCVDRVVKAVDASGAAEDTILVFASDHGDMLQSQGLPRKQFPWDESIRVPFLVCYPRELGRERRKLQTPIDAPDIMPTLLGLSGLKIPESVQGRDFSPLMRGKREDPAAAALLNLPVSFSVIRRHGIAEYRGLRTMRHTLVRSIHGTWLLYDNEADPLQKRNLVGNPRYRELQASLERRLDRMLKAAGDEFLPGTRYVEAARATHYREVNAEPGKSASPWGDWTSTWR